MRTLTIKGRITLLYALLTALLPAVLLPVVYGQSPPPCAGRWTPSSAAPSPRS